MSADLRGWRRLTIDEAMQEDDYLPIGARTAEVLPKPQDELAEDIMALLLEQSA